MTPTATSTPTATPTPGRTSTATATATATTTATSRPTLLAISGVIFEDVGYTGGPGRDLDAAEGTGVAGARVELYNQAGALIDTEMSDADGSYSFQSLASGGYTVRVVNASVRSSRPSALDGLIPVQTFGSRAPAGVAVAVPNQVGGQDPARADAGNGVSQLADLNTASTVAQSVALVTLGAASVNELDFGYSFNLIVNTNDAGQGSLRQFILNSNALDQSDADRAYFMIPVPADPLGRPADPNVVAGRAVISLESALPAITGDATWLDGTTQTSLVGDTNPGLLGIGGVVGTDDLELPQVSRPEIELAATGPISNGLTIHGEGALVRGLAISGFTEANLLLEDAVRATVEENVIGTGALGFSYPGADYSPGNGIVLDSAFNNQIQMNLIGFHGRSGLAISFSAGNEVRANEIRANDQLDRGIYDGIDEYDGSFGNSTIGNLIVDNGATGVDANISHTIQNNTIVGNGVSRTSVETPGLRLRGDGSLVERNVIRANYGAGILVQNTAQQNRIIRNAIFDNGEINSRDGDAATGQIGIDLVGVGEDNSAGTPPFVTLNDPGGGDSGGNNLLNTPILTSALISGSELELSGFLSTGQVIELFIAEPDPGRFGEGATYLLTLTEGCAEIGPECAALDLDAGTGSYGPDPINGIAQGSDNASRFRFRLSLADLPGVGPETALTATSSVSSHTSEFSAVVIVGQAEEGQKRPDVATQNLALQHRGVLRF